jgi:hypothetical protein
LTLVTTVDDQVAAETAADDSKKITSITAADDQVTVAR